MVLLNKLMFSFNVIVLVFFCFEYREYSSIENRWVEFASTDRLIRVRAEAPCRENKWLYDKNLRYFKLLLSEGELVTVEYDLKSNGLEGAIINFMKENGIEEFNPSYVRHGYQKQIGQIIVYRKNIPYINSFLKLINKKEQNLGQNLPIPSP